MVPSSWVCSSSVWVCGCGCVLVLASTQKGPRRHGGRPVLPGEGEAKAGFRDRWCQAHKKTGEVGGGAFLDEVWEDGHQRQPCLLLNVNIHLAETVIANT